MADSEADICNLALAGLGHTKFISSLDDKTQEGFLCKRFYPHTRDKVLERMPWPFAKRRIAMTALTGPLWTVGATFAKGTFATFGTGQALYVSLQDANTGHQPDTSGTWWSKVSRDEWENVYLPPADCLKIRTVFPPGLRNPREDQQIVYDRENDAVLGEIILTDEEKAVLFYTAQITDVTTYAEDLVEAIAAELAIPLAAALRKDAAVVRQAKAFADDAGGEASSSALQEVQPDPAPLPDWIAKR